MTEEEEFIEEMSKDIEKLAEVTAIFNKVIERLKNGEKVIEIEETMEDQLDRADILIGEVYFGK